MLRKKKKKELFMNLIGSKPFPLCCIFSVKKVKLKLELNEWTFGWTLNVWGGGVKNTPPSVDIPLLVDLGGNYLAIT